MAKLIEQLLEPCLGGLIFQMARQDELWVHFLPKSELGELARAGQKTKFQLLTGSETKTGTLFHRKQAFTLGTYAKKVEASQNDSVLAVLFRDSDGTQKCPRTDWQDKLNSIVKGFEAARFEGGAAMVPKPKSEAWLLCALKHNYQHCDSLEDESGNDNSPNNLKKQLTDHLGCDADREQLNDLVETGQIIARQIKMPSFVAFLSSLARAAHHNGLDASEM